MAEKRRDNTPMFDYYKAWDKFAANVDEEAENVKESDKSKSGVKWNPLSELQHVGKGQ